MILLKGALQLSAAAPLFAGWQETMIFSCLEGEMGSVWVDDAQHPTWAQATLGDFTFFTGDASKQGAQAAAASLLEKHPNGFALAVPRDEAWAQLIADAHKGACKKITRYAFAKSNQSFDKAKLQAYASGLPAGYTMRPMGAHDYDTAMAHEWSRDLCSQYASAQDYAARGMGVGVFAQGELVCGASSYSHYKSGIEIQIDTRVDHQRKGLATACAARLMLACLQQNWHPSWDAANLQSVLLAQKLGYIHTHAYTAFVIGGAPSA